MAIISFTCKRNIGDGPYLPPHGFFFLIKKNGAKLPDSILDNVKLYYYQNGVKTYVSDFGRAINEGDFHARDSGILATRNIGYSSGNDGVKTYFLEYLYGYFGPQDTLYADIPHLSEKDARRDPCYCYYPIREIKFNGQVAYTDPSIVWEPVYLFYKP